MFDHRLEYLWFDSVSPVGKLPSNIIDLPHLVVHDNFGNTVLTEGNNTVHSRVCRVCLLSPLWSSRGLARPRGIINTFHTVPFI